MNLRKFLKEESWEKLGLGLKNEEESSGCEPAEKFVAELIGWEMRPERKWLDGTIAHE
jgi:hypothetical protein